MPYCAHCGAEVGSGAAACAACGKPPRSHPRPATGAGRGPSTAVVLIVVVFGCMAAVAVIGILAAVLIPNFLDATHKAKQKRTVADMREVGIAWMTWASDEVAAVPAGAATTYDFGALEQTLSAAQLERQLRLADERLTLDRVPAFDGWGHSYDFRQAADLLAESVIAIRSPGRDGAFSADLYTIGTFPPREFDEDIVWADGFFLRAPDGEVVRDSSRRGEEPSSASTASR